MESLELSLVGLGLLAALIGLAFAGWRQSRTQRMILANTVRILAVCESIETFYTHAVDAQRAVELAVAAGIANETLQETLQTSMAMMN